MSNYNFIPVEGGVPIKAWTKGVPVDPQAEQQLRNVAALPFVFRHVAVMPDVHGGKGATIGSVIATHKAIIPAAVDVDIGCGMMAVRTTVRAEHLPDTLHDIRTAIEAAVPHGRTDNGGANDRGAWAALAPEHEHLCEQTAKIAGGRTVHHLGTLGIGNKIGTVFIELAKKDMERFFIRLPDTDLAYFPEGTDHFAAHMRAVSWAQKFACTNRQLMMDATLGALARFFPDVAVDGVAVNCHHNYVNTETHFGQTVLVTRKGAVRAKAGDLGIIPGSMGAHSFIVRSKGEAEAAHSRHAFSDPWTMAKDGKKWVGRLVRRLPTLMRK